MKKVRQINKGCIREGSTWLICICLTPVQKDALSFLLIFFFSAEAAKWVISGFKEKEENTTHRMRLVGTIPLWQEYSRTTHYCLETYTIPLWQEYSRTTHYCLEIYTIPLWQEYSRTTNYSLQI